ncbi:MAG: hypothetical protein II911_06255 [Clostridia bacterium]|nr:hypothetical protein [Clostridia bacterium]
MDYLNDGDPASGKSLGVEGIWLTPIFQSPSYHKYDVTDYYTIDPDFGTMDDLKELIRVCHERGVIVILDLVLNHTGNKNPWYQSFRTAHMAGNTENEYYNFYCWCPKSEPKPAGRVFQPIAGSDDYYECNFSTDMPELDYDRPEVRQAVLDVAKFYLDMGIDGFRFDAAKYIYLGDNKKSAEFWTWYMEELRKINPDVWTVAEVWDSDGVTNMYAPALDCFNFTVSQVSGQIVEAAKGASAARLMSYTESFINTVKGMRQTAQFVPFIGNHDTDRSAGFLPVSQGRMQMGANLLILGPGAPFIYYGEEIGIKGSRGGSNTDANRRLAMLWGDGDTVKDPQGADYPEKNQVKATVKDQLADQNSLFNYYKKLIAVRRANPEIAYGDYKAVTFQNSKVAGFTASAATGTVCVLHNTTDDEQKVVLDEVGLASLKIASVCGAGEAALSDDGLGVLTIGPRTSVVLR